ncbi:MAG: hypothetical protein EOM90_01815 [Alphaproteobacteria bacterium]|nr:hypothetical protein [Alphaproteobacteria bacterium]
MTFIASVVAKDGVVIIADSLVTSVRPILTQRDLAKYYTEKVKLTGTETFPFNVDEINDLFSTQRHHTENYENKLIQYDKYTAITTAGSALINGKRISDIVEKIKSGHKKGGLDRTLLENKVDEICTHLTIEVKSHFDTHSEIDSTHLIITHFDHKISKTQIFKIKVNEASKKQLSDNGFEFVTKTLVPEYETVISDGQNRIVEGVLWGAINSLPYVTLYIARRIRDDFNISPDKMTKEYMTKLMNDDGIRRLIMKDANLPRMKELSLQQAVDLAYLCLKIEMDFQNYTEDIPVVGGIIRLATINKDGFSFLCGNSIVSPINGNL